MKLGLLTAAFADSDLHSVAGWATDNGFTALEIACWPPADGPVRRYAGVSHLDVGDLGAARAELAAVTDLGIEVSALGYYPNPLSADDDERDAAIGHIERLIDAAAALDIGLVNTFIGNDKTKPFEDNFATFTQLWPDVVRRAADAGVKIAIENCPMIFSADEWPGGNNLMHTPARWQRVFDYLADECGDTSTLGLNLDPSHLVWQMIDIERVVGDFADRIYHVHAKDLEIDREGLYQHGVMSAGVGWQVPRLPGLGEVPWNRFVAALYRAGYDGPVIVEHEDRDFEGTDEKVKAGFLLARNAVAPYIV